MERYKEAEIDKQVDSMRSIRFSFKNKVVLSNYLTQNFLLFKQQDKCTFKLHDIHITMVFTTVNRRKKYHGSSYHGKSKGW